MFLPLARMLRKRARAAARPVAARPTFRPQLAMLEDRVVPTVAGTVVITGEASLRAALVDPTALYIHYDPSLSGQTMSLTGGEFQVNHTCTVTGLGTAHSIIDAHGASRIFDITTSGITFNVVGLTLANGDATAASPNGAAGGAIYSNNGSLSVLNTTLVNNIAQGANAAPGGNGGDALGGGIYFGNPTGSLSLTGVRFTTNDAIGGAGGSVGLTRSFDAGNGGQGLGGAVYNAGGTVSVQHDIFTSNEAIGGQGGQIVVNQTLNAILQRSSTVVAWQLGVLGSNQSNTAGGTRDIVITLGQGGTGAGGALYNAGGSVNDYSNEFTGNEAIGGQGGDVNISAYVNLTLSNTVNLWVRQYNIGFSPALNSQTNFAYVSQTISLSLGHGGSATGGALANVGGTLVDDLGNYRINQAIGGQGGAATITAPVVLNFTNNSNVSVDQSNYAVLAPGVAQLNGLYLSQSIAFSVGQGGSASGGADYGNGGSTSLSDETYKSDTSAGGAGGATAISAPVVLSFANLLYVGGSQVNFVRGSLDATQTNADVVNQSITDPSIAFGQGGSASGADSDSPDNSITTNNNVTSFGQVIPGPNGPTVGLNQVSPVLLNALYATLSQTNTSVPLFSSPVTDVWTGW